ncbi:SDR family NAD(P)-dependent oxidoreductase [Rhodococcoides kyotonense]|uniref:NAD(P)-dependent dehydrogenase, short-chain alcohol dehydrogenase family n=1 Tax=Rhodococcoides kyotonense TaxID=398843 RepID=A0A239JZ66_9NOCA|nr:glucose 1-dehydrogenase [Rhodococcus kyotonensis]SNT11317.1 NAD(P)-dependent dehydrogenase, short-chain alcohol dehydrogenase family [Rhodococcus kyotonensis]
MSSKSIQRQPVSSRFSLEGTVAVVTGASSGLGAAYAIALAESGASLVLGARREDKLNMTADAVRAVGADVVTAVTDVVSPDDCTALVDAGMSRFGRIDALVNNAGTGGEYHRVDEDTPDHFRRVVETNLHGSYWMVQACTRVMLPGSAIVNISSVMALTTARMPAAAYSASKAAILGMTRDLAAQLGPRGIRVNAVLPGVFPSEATEHYSENYKRKIVDARIPIGRIGDPTDIAAAVVFLVSDAANYITGVSLPVDGGILVN